MIKKIKKVIIDNKLSQKEIMLQLKEIEWGLIFQDSIKGNQALKNLSLNIGRWSGNYSFFYVLNRILADYKPLSILEIGLGESTKFISTFIENDTNSANHLIIEQNQDWINSFNEKFKLSNNSRIIFCPIKNENVKGHNSIMYSGLNNKITTKFNLYVIDGPHGSDRYSRYDILGLAEKFTSNDEFIILFDDTNRKGEMDTVTDLISLLESKKIQIHIGSYSGNKSQTIIATNKYKFTTSF